MTIWLRTVATRLSADSDPLRVALQREAAEILRLRSVRLHTADPTWPEGQADAFLAQLVLDPKRFGYDPDFRSVVTPVLEGGVDVTLPVHARERMLSQLNARASLEFGLAERIALSWRLKPRASSAREVVFESMQGRFAQVGRIEASIFDGPRTFAVPTSKA